MSDDLISRQAAIDALKEKVFSNLTDEFYGAMQVLDELPSAQPTIEERKKGKWVKDEDESAKHIEAIYFCSACHNFEAWGETEKYNFCPNCGADMRGEE